MKVELTIPDSLEEISLEQYQEFVKAQEENTDQLFISQKLVSIFCCIPMSNVLVIPLTEVEYIVEKIGKLFNREHKFQRTFTIKGKKFGFIPNLEDISLGEFVDLDANISNLSNYHKALAVMYRPIKKSSSDLYEIEDYNGTITYSDVMKLAPVSIALGAQVFFWNLETESLKALIVYLEKEGKEVMSLAKRGNLVESGDGINTSISSLREMYLTLTQSQNNRFLNV